MGSPRQLVQWCIYIIVALQIASLSADERSRYRFGGQSRNMIYQLSGMSQCATKRCNRGTVCRMMQSTTRSAPRPQCVSRVMAIASESDDDDCRMAGCGPAVLLGSSLAPRTMRCVPWSRSMARGGCGVGSSCVGGGPTASGRQAAGTCCSDDSTSSARSTSSRQSVSTQRGQRQVVARAQAIARQSMGQAMSSRDSRDSRDSRYSRDSRDSRSRGQSFNQNSQQFNNQQSMDQPDITIINITPDVSTDDNRVVSLGSNGIVDALSKVDSLDDSKIIQVNTYQPIVQNSFMGKLGSCPLSSDIFFNTCDNGGFECADDVDCPDDLKCCSSSCGIQYCTVPMPDF